MTVEFTLLTLTWALPLVLGLIQIAYRKQFIPFGALGAVPGLLAALLVPEGSALDYSSLLLGTIFQFDFTARMFLLFTALLWLVAGLFAAVYLRQDGRRGRFFAFFLMAMAGNFGLILSGDMASFYTFFALMSFASYALIVHTGQSEAFYAGRIYMVLVIVGEVLLFGGLVLIAAATGSTSFAVIATQALDPLPLLMIFASFGIKAGVVALHTWLPLAHPAAPIPASAVLSGAMIKAGVIGWMRFMGDAGPDWGQFILALGVLTAFFGALMGVSQVNPKTVLAYSSISQMGFIMVGVGAWFTTGRADDAALIAIVLYALHHALAKGALFLGVAFAGSGRIVTAALLLPALALAGLPFTSGAVAKAALKSVTDALPNGLGSALSLPLSLAAVGTTLLMARYLWLIYHNPAAQKKHPPLMWGLWAALLAAVALSMFVLPEAAKGLEKSLEGDKPWAATWPILLGAGLAAVASRVGGQLKLPLVKPGDMLSVYNLFARAGVALVLAVVRGLSDAQNAALRALSHADVAPLRAALGRVEFWVRSDYVVAGSLLLAITLGVLLMTLLTR
ncbi:complex I subunit 5 family protein [Aggregatilineales bacterium SYSU G02658]